MKWYNRWNIKELWKSNMKNGAIYYLWGQPYRLQIKVGNHIEIVDTELHFYTKAENSQEENRDILLSWYDKLLSNEIEIMKDRIEAIVGEKADHYFVGITRLTRGTWGICDTRWKQIGVNTRVVFFRKEILEWILTHEILHLKINGHGKEFYVKLSEYCPNWRVSEICATWENPDYRYYDYLYEKMVNHVPVPDDYEEYCNKYDIKKEIL